MQQSTVNSQQSTVNSQQSTVNSQQSTAVTVIWKYELSHKVRTELQLPVGAEILHVDFQRDGIFLWAKVPPKALTITRTIEVYGTGHDIPGGVSRRFINTFFSRDNDHSYVFHAFEVI